MANLGPHFLVDMQVSADKEHHRRQGPFLHSTAWLLNSFSRHASRTTGEEQDEDFGPKSLSICGSLQSFSSFSM